MQPRDFFPRPRLDAVTDGVLAITMTLLVLSLDVPDTLPAGLWPALVELKPKLFSWLISFLILAQFWVTQVRAMRDVEHIDSGLFRIIVVWLACISLLPFASSLIGEHPNYLGSHIVYATNLIGVELAVIWRSWHLRRHPALFAPGADTRSAELWFRPLAVAGCAALSIAIATLWSSRDSSIGYLLLFPLVFWWERRSR
ncbi:MAG: TMEM175 family protein [Amaricoccus sp.]